jgi:hypothetical protein
MDSTFLLIILTDYNNLVTVHYFIRVLTMAPRTIPYTMCPPRLASAGR